MPLEQIGTLLGVILVFVVILYASYYCSKKIAKFSLRDNQSKYMKLHDRIMVGQNKYISIISVGERYFMVGSSDDGMDLIAELRKEDLPEVGSASPLSAAGHLDFKEILKNIKQKNNTKV